MATGLILKKLMFRFGRLPGGSSNLVGRTPARSTPDTICVSTERIVASERTMIVFPVPGPPPRLGTLLLNAASMAAICPAANAKLSGLYIQSIALSIQIRGHVELLSKRIFCKHLAILSSMLFGDDFCTISAQIVHSLPKVVKSSRRSFTRSGGNARFCRSIRCDPKIQDFLCIDFSSSFGQSAANTRPDIRNIGRQSGCKMFHVEVFSMPFMNRPIANHF